MSLQVTNNSSVCVYNRQQRPRFKQHKTCYYLPTEKTGDTNKVPLFVKGLIGLSSSIATLYGALVAKRIITKPTLQKVSQNFTEIFKREVSQKEAQEICARYEELLKIEDFDLFTRKAFEQIKNDYGYKDLDIKLKINYFKDNKSFLKKIVKNKNFKYGCWNCSKGEIEINSLKTVKNKHNNVTRGSKREVLSIFMHEFQHVKQDEIAYRTNSVEFTKAYKDRINKQLPGRIVSTDLDEGVIFERDIAISNMKKTLDDLFGRKSKYNPNSKEYELGQKYIDNCKNYIVSEKNYKKYKEQMVEREAFVAQKKFNQNYNFFSSPWRFFDF